MNFSRESLCSTQAQHRYVPPYERLLRRNQAWKPKKVKLEAELQEEYRQGTLTPFQQPQNYRSKITKHYSTDTEDDALTHKPATLQVEYIKQNSSSIIIIIEVQYLPSRTSPLFKQIQQLCSIIFTSQNYIYSWGSALQEL
ncbi:unnamed protein product, partial [Rotaria magnacalcarata]